MNSPELAPGLVLARAGFDVWLGNNRGNYFSKDHVHFTPDEKEFWDWDWEEMGTYDLPAMIDYILITTNQHKLRAFIGHSQGTTQMFAGMSLMPEYFESHVEMFIALAPVVSLYHTSNDMLIRLTPMLNTIKWWLEWFGMYDVFARRSLQSKVSTGFCYTFPDLCTSLKLGFLDENENENNKDSEKREQTPKNSTERAREEEAIKRAKLRVERFPSGNGWRNLVHFGQIIQAKRFQRYDYGDEKMNLQKYGAPRPPEYDLSKIKNKMAIFAGESDTLSDPKDVAWLLDENQSHLNHKLIVEYLPLKGGHDTFMMGEDMSYLNTVIKILVY